MLDDILKAIPFGIVLAFTVGPVFFVLIETSATRGFKSALVFDLGVIVADIIFIGIAYFSTGSIIEKIKKNPNFLIFGGILLVVYGLVSFVKTSRSFRTIVTEYNKTHIKKGYGKFFIKGFLLNSINIGVLIGWLSFIVIGSSITTSRNGTFVFIITMLFTYFVVDLFKIALAKRFKTKLNPKIIYKTKKIIALAILGFGVVLLIEGLFPELYKKSKEKIEKVNPINLPKGTY